MLRHRPRRDTPDTDGFRARPTRVAICSGIVPTDHHVLWSETPREGANMGMKPPPESPRGDPRKAGWKNPDPGFRVQEVEEAIPR